MASLALTTVAYAQGGDKAAVEKQLIENQRAINAAFAKGDVETFFSLLPKTTIALDYSGLTNVADLDKGHAAGEDCELERSTTHTSSVASPGHGGRLRRLSRAPAFGKGVGHIGHLYRASGGPDLRVRRSVGRPAIPVDVSSLREHASEVYSGVTSFLIPDGRFVASTRLIVTCRVIATGANARCAGAYQR